MHVKSDKATRAEGVLPKKRTSFVVCRRPLALIEKSQITRVHTRKKKKTPRHWVRRVLLLNVKGSLVSSSSNFLCLSSPRRNDFLCTSTSPRKSQYTWEGEQRATRLRRNSRQFFCKTSRRRAFLGGPCIKCRTDPKFATNGR